MGATKTELFTRQQNELAAMAKAIAHPARIAILQYLVKTNACVCGEIVDELGLAQATTSQHLKELKEQGVIQGTIEGPKSCYCIDWKILSEKLQQLNSYTENLKTLNKKINSKCC
jgi:predicted transcriptional regulator